MIVRFRPLAAWPHPETPAYNRRSSLTFKAGWEDTRRALIYEIERLGGTNVILGAFFAERDIRLDGLPRSDARVPSHPGIELSFDSRHGRLVYATDVCARWDHNVRSVALGLEALRAVDRYGISARGQQYAGWKALPAGSGSLRLPATLEQAVALLEELLEVEVDIGTTDMRSLLRSARKLAHPDAGGDPETFAGVQAAAAILESSGMLA